jgi:hypothetical protein
MKIWAGIKFEEGIEHLPKQELKKLIVEWAKILNSDGRDHDTYSSRRRRKNYPEIGCPECQGWSGVVIML